MLFAGFKRCLYGIQKFHSDSERRFSVILEYHRDVLKWFKPAKGQFQIHYRRDQEYEPDFVVETKSAKFLCEPRRASQNSEKPWSYLLIPHDAIMDNKTLRGLAATYRHAVG